ncbi:MAG: O-antigen ligase family protein [Burkholderiaceae bacterium]
MDPDSRARSLARLAGALLLGSAVGGLAVMLVGGMRLDPMIGFAVPILVAGLFLLLTRFDWLLIAVMVTRASLDPILSLIKGGGEGVGPGAAINAAVLLLGALYLLRKPRAFARPHVLLWGLFLALAFSACRYAPDVGKASRMLVVYMTYAVMFAMPLAIVDNRTDARFWVRVLLIASIVPTLAGLFDMATGGVKSAESELLDPSVALTGLPERAGFRIQGAFTHPNIFAFYLVTLIATLLYAWRIGVFSGRTRWLAGLYMVVQIILLVSTQTRSAWVAAAVVLFGYGVFVDRRLLLWGAIGCVSLLLVPVVQDRVLEVFGHGAPRMDDVLNSYQWRLAMWKSALPWIADRWLLGWGLDSYIGYSPIFFPLEYVVGFDAHSVYVQLAFEMGVPGAIAFALIFVGLIVMAFGWRRRHPLEAVLLICLSVAFLIVCYSDNMHRYLISNWYTFFFMGLLAAVATGSGRLEGGTGARRPKAATR